MMKQGWIAALLMGASAVVAGPLDDARSSYSRGQFRNGDRILLDWLAANPDDPEIREGFHLLVKEEALGKRQWPAALDAWAEESTLRGNWSRFYSGIVKRGTGEYDESIDIFRGLIDSQKIVEAARLELVVTYLAADMFSEAESMLQTIAESNPDAGVMTFLRGQEVRFWLRKAEPIRALEVFDGTEMKDLVVEDLFHAGLAAMLAGETQRADFFRKELEQRGEESYVGELDFEKGLLEASQLETVAFETLAEFLREYPDHPRAADAEIALAEMHLNQVPPQPQAARDRQENARKRALTLDQSERLDYSAIWTERIGGDLAAVVERAARFLDLWPRSGRRPNVMLMLGRAHYDLGHFPEAVERFEQLSAIQEETEVVEVALFFAAKAASRTMTFENHEKAQIFWETVVERGGKLAANARHEQGLLHLANNEVDEALVAFEDVLTGEYGISDELRIATLCDGGHGLFLKALENGSDKSLLSSAIASFKAAEENPSATKAWQYQAKVRRGKCLEALGQFDEALLLYFSVVKESSLAKTNFTASIPMVQFDWLYRAGFSAIELLEDQENWKEAVMLAELLADTGGPRAIEADERANSLRLKHFVWEGDE